MLIVIKTQKTLSLNSIKSKGFIQITVEILDKYETYLKLMAVVMGE
jgi:hypothetical protein